MDLIMVLLNIMIFDDREMFRERNIDDKTMLHLFSGGIRTLTLIFTLLLKLTLDQRYLKLLATSKFHESTVRFW